MGRGLLGMGIGLDRHTAVHLVQGAAVQKLPDIPADGVQRDVEMRSQILQ